MSACTASSRAASAAWRVAWRLASHGKAQPWTAKLLKCAPLLHAAGQKCYSVFLMILSTPARFEFSVVCMGGQGARRKRNWRHNRPGSPYYLARHGLAGLCPEQQRAAEERAALEQKQGGDGDNPQPMPPPTVEQQPEKVRCRASHTGAAMKRAYSPCVAHARSLPAGLTPAPHLCSLLRTAEHQQRAARHEGRMRCTTCVTDKPRKGRTDAWTRKG